jgi:hypothetical protein
VNREDRGRELFIVDNSVSGWTGLRYLEEWTLISNAFDIATGYFEIGALLALDGNWQALDKIRILMGADIWLKDRKGRTLSKDDIDHYQKIVVALAETIRLMKEIDEVIEQHGGWPGAFADAQGMEPRARL